MATNFAWRVSSSRGSKKATAHSPAFTSHFFSHSSLVVISSTFISYSTGLDLGGAFPPDLLLLQLSWAWARHVCPRRQSFPQCSTFRCKCQGMRHRQSPTKWDTL